LPTALRAVFALAVTALIAPSLAIATVGPATAASQSSPAVTACLAAHSGAVTWDQVGDGDDTVCVDTTVTASPGDDRYYWVGADTDPAIQLRPLVGSSIERDQDPGNDTLSLADWSQPWVDQYNAIGYGGMFGVRVWLVPDTVVYTNHNDVVGDPNGCGRLTSSNTMHFEFGAGDDTVNCITGWIDGGTGNDRILGVTLGSTAVGGEGDDYITGDADADLIDAGTGNDIIEIVGGDTDEVIAEPVGDPTVETERTGAVAKAAALAVTGDLVYADGSDKVVGAATVIVPTVTKTKKVTRMVPTHVTKMVTKRVHKKIWNRRHTRKVWKWVHVQVPTQITIWVPKQVTITVQVPVGPDYTGWVGPGTA
jgi:Ca2+-binding RTX toxin-like protein